MGKELLLSDGNSSRCLFDPPLTARGIQVNSFEYKEKATFLQYVKSGLDINFMVAIDFTGSNGDPSSPTSLHYFNSSLFANGQLNPYEQAIATVGGVLEFYDNDRFFPTYGFGACLNGNRTSSHCFAVNRNEADPNVFGVQGIIDAYHAIVPMIRFSGPTLFANVLMKAVECGFVANMTCRMAKTIQAEKNKYLILLLITDGLIDDMENTIQLIVEGADYPLSILIVGVGDADFSRMEVLDGDDVRLEYRGKKASRDIVQFVSLNSLANHDPQEIARQLLEEIPTQVTDYMEANGITPEVISSRTLVIPS